MPDDLEPARTLRRWKRILVFGIVLATGPALGFAGLLFGMLQSFHTIESHKAPTPDDLAAGVQFGTISSLVGLLSGVVGALLIVLACSQIARTRDHELSEAPSP
jgi:biopolymer transport protein ExbB/TolQ